MTRKLTLMILGPILAAAPAAALFAQYPVQNGHALDRNLQLGSGGINAPHVTNNAGQYGNAIVTGNTGGLSSFHGSVNYRAPGEFTGALPSGELNQYDFLRQSLPQNSPYGSAQLLPQQTAPGILFRPGTGVLGGQITGGYEPYSSTGVPVYRSDVNSLNVNQIATDGRRELGPTPLVSPPSSLAFTRDRLGNALQVTASPLTGLQTTNLGVPLNVSDTGLEPSPNAPTGAANNPAVTQPGETPGTPGTLTPGIAPGTTPPAAGSVNAQAPGQVPAGQVNAQLPSQVQARFNAQFPPTLILSQQITGTTAGTPNARGDVLENQVLHPQGWATAQPGQDVFADLLRRINDPTHRGANTPGTPAGGGANVPGAIPPNQLAAPAPQPPQQPAVGAGGLTGPQPVPGTPAGDHLAAPPPIGVAHAKPPQTNLEKIAQEFEQAQQQPSIDQRQAQENREQFDELMGKLSYDLPPLGSIAGTQPGPYNAAMRQAEQQMAGGQYFAAEDSYLRAMTLRRRHPMADVGRINAQLGAGLYVAAAYNLRQLFLLYPQLIAARYTAPVLPGAQRMVRILSELQSLQQQNPTADTQLLLAYVAWQRRDLLLVRDTLHTMNARNPNDPLLPVIWRIWLPGERVPVHVPGESAPPNTPNPGTPGTPGTPGPGGSSNSGPPSNPAGR